jgi:hypothetical protein
MLFISCPVVLFGTAESVVQLCTPYIAVNWHTAVTVCAQCSRLRCTVCVLMLQSGASIEYAQQYSPRTSVYEFLGECSSYATASNGSATSATAVTSSSSSNSRSSRHYSGSAAGSSSSSSTGGVVPYVPGAVCIGLTGGFAKLWVAHDKETGRHYMSKVCMHTIHTCVYTACIASVLVTGCSSCEHA